MKTRQPISQEEVEQAIQKFKASGGLVKQLPPEIAIRTHVVGSRWGSYESPMELGETLEQSSD